MSEASDVAELAVRAAGTAQTIQEGEGWAHLAVPHTMSLEELDWTSHLAVPRRAKGTILVHDASSFLHALFQRAVPGQPPVLYADEESLALTAVLDDDHVAGAGWRQYRIALAMRPTPEWKAWKAADSRGMPQAAFADFVEEHIGEFQEPDGATMLELAQTMEGKTTARWKVGARLATGARQVMWEETVDAKAGQAGKLDIPDRVSFAVRPFFGPAEFWKVTALLRYTIREGAMVLTLKLLRPDDIERGAFNKVLAEVIGDEGFDGVVIKGPAPAQR